MNFEKSVKKDKRQLGYLTERTNKSPFFHFIVNLVYEQELTGTASMRPIPISQGTTANKAIDGDTNSCAITNSDNSVWWKVWLKKKFNIAYLEIHFKSNSK